LQTYGLQIRGINWVSTER